MGERLTYGIVARYPVVLVERLGGLFFDGRRSCTEDSFVVHSGLYHGESLVVNESIYLWLTRSPWNRKGMVSFTVLSTNTKQALPQSVRRSAFMLTSGELRQLLAQPGDFTSISITSSLAVFWSSNCSTAASSTKSIVASFKNFLT